VQWTQSIIPLYIEVRLQFHGEQKQEAWLVLAQCFVCAENIVGAVLTHVIVITFRQEKTLDIVRQSILSVRKSQAVGGFIRKNSFSCADEDIT